MKKITLTESDLLNIVKRVLNEQNDRELPDPLEPDEAFVQVLCPPFNLVDTYQGIDIMNCNGQDIGGLYFDSRYEAYVWSMYSTHTQAIYELVDPESYADGGDFNEEIAKELRNWMEDQINLPIVNIEY